MPCLRIAGGHVCVRGQRPKRCRECGELATKQCDYRLRSGRSCDDHLCDAHAHVQPGTPSDPSHGSIDYCTRHAVASAASRARPVEQLQLEGLC
jgi:hypothetical protein